MVAQNSHDGTGGFGIGLRHMHAAAASIEQSQGTVAFPSTAPKASPTAVQPVESGLSL